MQEEPQGSNPEGILVARREPSSGAGELDAVEAVAGAMMGSERSEPSAPLADMTALARGTWEKAEREALDGATAVIFSISAGEGPNTILRNVSACEALRIFSSSLNATH